MLYDELDEKETFWGLAPAAIGELRRSEYDQAVRFYMTRFDKWRDQEVSKRTEFQKAQGWLYLQMCSSFTKTNLVKIQQYESSKFRKDVMARNPTFLIDAPEVIYLPHGSLCYQVLKHEVQEGEQSWAMLEVFTISLIPILSHQCSFLWQFMQPLQKQFV